MIKHLLSFLSSKCSLIILPQLKILKCLEKLLKSQQNKDTFLRGCTSVLPFWSVLLCKTMVFATRPFLSHSIKLLANFLCCQMWCAALMSWKGLPLESLNNPSLLCTASGGNVLIFKILFARAWRPETWLGGLATALWVLSIASCIWSSQKFYKNIAKLWSGLKDKYECIPLG